MQLAAVLVYCGVSPAVATTISGNLSGTLDLAGSPYIAASNLRVPPGQTLVIEPGVIVKMGADLRFLVEGTLTAVAPPAQPVIITSYRDDSAGGDTNGDGNATLPARRDWGEIYFNAGSSASVMDGVTVRYGGSAATGSQANIYVTGSAPTITRCDISQGGYYGLHAQEPGLPFTIAGNHFHHNGQTGLRVGALVSVTGNQFDNQGYSLWFGGPKGVATFSGNTFTQTQGIYLESVLVSPRDGGGNTFAPGMAIFVPSGSGSIGQNGQVLTVDATWDINGIPYVIGNGAFAVAGGVTLTIGPGVVVKFSNNMPSTNSSLFEIDGTLLAQGTANAPITFTSFRDDTVGGDSNQDGAATQPAPGDWPGIYLNTTSGASRLDYVSVRYGGWTFAAGPNNYNANITARGTAAVIDHCEITRSLSTGFYADASATPTIQHCDFHDNTNFGLNNHHSSAPVLRFNTFRSHPNYGVINSDPSVLLDASMNYWGSPTGPIHSSNPGGTGDRVSDDVNYSPFLTSPSSGPVTPPPPPPPNLPSPPGNLQATAGDTLVDLTWTPSPTVGVTGYNIYRDGGTFPLNAQPLPASRSTYRDIALTDGRTYSYEMTAIDGLAKESLRTPKVQVTPVAGAGW